MDWLDIKEFLSDTIKYIIFIVVILVIAVYVVGLQQIVGPSMTPTLRNGDIVILDKLSYRFSEIKRDDIVALYYADTKFLVKRVVGLPGETVEFKDNKLYINGKYYEEKYLCDDTVTDNFSLEELNYTTIPDDMYLVLGDNRGDSMDSRDSDVGLIPKKDIYGKVRFKIWPINEFKYVK